MNKPTHRTTTSPTQRGTATIQLRRKRISQAIALALAASINLPAEAQATLPTGGQVTAGNAAVSQSSANELLVKQNTDKLSMSWQTFDIGAGNSVRFEQPSASSIALNRVLGSNRSEIYGNLSANGQVFLINPNGVLFGAGAQVDVGGLVASTLNLTDRDFLDGKFTFSDPSNRASVVNEGNLVARNGGYLALLGHHVDNTGTMQAYLGSVVLGAGGTAQLTLADSSLVKFEVTQSALDALAENGGLIRADGGLVLLTAGARDSLLASQVNNTGVIEARTVERQSGNILLLAGMEAGTTHVSGTLDASAPASLNPTGGDGGFIETSGAHVNVAPDARITTAAPQGKTGKWLIDPQDFTIGTDMTGTALSLALVSNNVEIQSSAGGTAGNGDINVNDDVNWGANTLTLTAARDININALMIAADPTSIGTSKLVMNTGMDNGADTGVAGGTVKFSVDAVNMGFPGQIIFDRSGTNFLTINGQDYTVIRDINELQAMSGNLAGHYALGTQIDASATSGWNAGAGFAPVGGLLSAFTGVFDGLGHTVSGLTINLPVGSSQVGLFGATNGATLRNVDLAGGSVAGGLEVGGLAGRASSSTIHNVLSGVAVTGATAGGLVGMLVSSSASNAHATGAVTGRQNPQELGGLVGLFESGSLDNVSASGDILSGGAKTGGLVGANFNGTISRAHASGNVTSGTTSVGGLVGLNSNGRISDSYATGDVTTGASGVGVGGLLGTSDALSSIVRSYAEGAVVGRMNVGGLVGLNDGALDTVHAIGSVTGVVTGSPVSGIGGLVGSNGAIITNAYATGAVSHAGGTTNFASGVGGLIGINSGSVGDSYATGNVTVSGTNSVAVVTPPIPALTPSEKVGGLIGDNSGALTNVRASGDVSNTGDYTGGLVGYNYGAAITGSSGTPVLAQGSVTGDGSWVGGAVGYNERANLTWVSASGAVLSTAVTGGLVTGGGRFVGGLVGQHAGGTIDQGRASGDVQGRLQVGGLAGQLSADPAASPMGTSLVSSSASGDVRIVTATVAGSVGRAGGLVGHVSSAQTLRDLEATGDVDGGSTTLIGGLIGELSSGTPLERGVAYGSVAGGQVIGGLVGNNVYSAITDSHAHGNVTAAGPRAGGLVGQNGGDISRSYAEGNVTGAAENVGGLVGLNSVGALTEVYATGSASGTSDVGGLVGRNEDRIIDSYSTGAVSASVGNAGGLVGSGGTTTGSFWDIETSGQTTSAGGTGKTSVEMKQMATFSGWDIARTGGSGAVWRIYEGNTAPLLRTFLASLTLTNAPDATLTYNGATQNGGTTSIVNSAVLGAAASGRNAGFYNGYYSTQQGYDLVGGNLTIDPATLVLSTNNVTKTYDGTTSAAGTAAVAGGALFGSDSLSGGTFAFTDKNAGIGNKTVTVSAVTVNDGNGGANYNVTYTNNTTSTIDRATVSASGITANNKSYDGTTAATIDTSVASALNGVIGSDDVSLPVSGLTASFADRHADTGKTVNLSGAALSGTDAGNYILASVAPVTADITPANLTLSTSNVTKTYDGTTSAAGTAMIASGTLFGSDSVSGGTFAFTDKNAGSNKTVTVTGVTVNDGNGGMNYNVAYANNTTSAITPKALTITADNANKTYGTTYPFAGTEFAATGLVSGETIGNVALSSTGSSASAAVAGNPYAITASGASGGSFDINNYNVSYVDGNLTVARAPLTVTAIGDTKLYDGNAYSGGNGVTYSGFVNGESSAVLGGTLVYGGSAQGAVNLGIYAISPGGLSADNYTIAYTNGALMITDATGGVGNPPSGASSVSTDMDTAIASAKQTDAKLDNDEKNRQKIRFAIVGAGMKLPQGAQ